MVKGMNDMGLVVHLQSKQFFTSEMTIPHEECSLLSMLTART